MTPLDSSSPELLRARTTVPLGQGFKRFAPCMASFAVAAQASVFRRLRAVIGARNDPRLVKPKACSAAAKSCPRNHFQKATTVSGYPRGGFFMPFLRDLPGRMPHQQPKIAVGRQAGRPDLVVRLNGAKLWRTKCRFPGGGKLLSLGAYPNFSLARPALADRSPAELAQGHDPGGRPRLRPSWRSRRPHARGTAIGCRGSATGMRTAPRLASARCLSGGRQDQRAQRHVGLCPWG